MEILQQLLDTTQGKTHKSAILSDKWQGGENKKEKKARLPKCQSKLKGSAGAMSTSKSMKYI